MAKAEINQYRSSYEFLMHRYGADDIDAKEIQKKLTSVGILV